MLNVRLNGEDHRAEDGESLLDLLSGVGKDPRTVAIELNGQIVSRSDFSSRKLMAGDRIEIVEFVQGGAVVDESTSVASHGLRIAGNSSRGLVFSDQ